MPDSIDTQSNPDSAPETTNPTTTAAPETTNPTTTAAPQTAGNDVEQPFFLVTSKPDTTYGSLDDATKAADDMATLHPGVEIYVLEARRSVFSPKPDVQTKDLPQE